MIQKNLDLCRPYFSRIALAMKQNELLNPVAIGGLCAGTEMAKLASDGNLLKKAGAAIGVVTL
jgi:hypothetical protein